MLFNEQNSYFSRDSPRFSANAFKALSNGFVALPHAKSNSTKLWAHFEAINSRPELKIVRDDLVYEVFHTHLISNLTLYLS